MSVFKAYNLFFLSSIISLSLISLAFFRLTVSLGRLRIEEISLILKVETGNLKFSF